MRIELRDQQRHRIGRVEVDPAARPTRVTTPDPSRAEREVFLNWEGALDDGGRLRRCVACGCPALYHEKAFPQITGFVVVLAFAGAAIGLLGLARTAATYIGLGVVLAVDVGILIFSKRRLVCYRCRTSYHDLEIARYLRAWDRTTADRHQPQRGAAESGEPGDRQVTT